MHLTRDTGEFNRENQLKQVHGMRQTTGMEHKIGIQMVHMVLPLKSLFKISIST